MPAQKTHEVVDIQTGKVTGSYGSLRRAHRAADRKDIEYGAVRYIVRRIMSAAEADQERERIYQTRLRCLDQIILQPQGFYDRLRESLSK